MQSGDVWARFLSTVVAEMVKRSVVAAVQRDLDALAKRDAALAESALAAVALSLAADVDDLSNSSTQRTGARRALADVLVQLREMAPADGGKDRLDELAERRASRRGAG